MTQPFTPAQSTEIDDRIVEMIVAVMGEGEYSRRCRAIANERYLDGQSQLDDQIAPDATAGAQLIATAPRDCFILACCQSVPARVSWPLAPWIIVRWHDETGTWRAEGGIMVKPIGWLPLTDQHLPLLSPEDSALSPAAADPALPLANGTSPMTAQQTIRLECLRTAAAIGGGEGTILAAARAFEAYVNEAAGETNTTVVDEGAVAGAAVEDAALCLRPLSPAQKDALRKLRAVAPGNPMPVQRALELAQALGDATMAEVIHAEETGEIDIENDGCVTSMLPDE